MRKGYTDGGPWCGNQVQTGPALIRGYSESLRDVVLPVAHVRIGVEAEGGGVEADEVGRRRSAEGGFPGGADEGETMGRRAGGESYHDTVSAQHRPPVSGDHLSNRGSCKDCSQR